LKIKPLDLNPEIYLRDDYVVLDFETTNLNRGSPVEPGNRVVLAVWRCGPTHPSFNRNPTEFEAYIQGRKRGLFAIYGSEFDLARLLDDIERASFLVAHNAKFEIGWLIRAGIEPRDIICWCTQIAEYVIAGNRKLAGGLSLDSTLERYKLGNKLHYVRTLIEQGVCPSNIPISDLVRYCVVDVCRTEDLFLRQRKRVFDGSLLNVCCGRNLCTPMLAEIESRGIQLAEERVYSVSKAEIGNYNRLTGELERFCGGINWNSPKQVGELLYSKLGFDELRDRHGEPIRTETGKLSTDERTISLLRARTRDQKEFLNLYLELAPLKKQVQILEKMLEACEQDKGLIYATFNQTVTQTHRLSSTGGKYGFQFQNIPRSFKRLFRARNKDWKIIDADCPQLEFRVGADLGHDATAKADVLGRLDIHKFSASILGTSRQDAKPHTFKPLYGGQSGTPRERAYYAAFRERYHSIYDTQMSWVYSVLEHKALKTATGLVFYWPDTKVTKSGWITNTPSIFNYPIQMFATADISQLSMLLVWHSLRGMASYISNTVHDSSVLECPSVELELVKEILVDAYTSRIYDTLLDLYGYSFSMPLGIGVKVGDFWGEAANEEKFENEEKFTWSKAA